MGLFTIVCSGTVVSMRVLAHCVSGSCCGVQCLWHTIRIVVGVAFSLAFILVQLNASRGGIWWSMGWARLLLVHLEDVVVLV